MSPQRRTALVSVGAAVLLIAIKLAAGLASGSLGLLAEAAHSGTDLAAALLTFFAVSVAVRPADPAHPYGHGKAQNLAALAEAGFLIAISLVISGLAIARLAGWVEFELETSWWTFAAIALVIAIDASRTYVSLHEGRRHRSDALLANALHFGSDLAGTLAVLAGLTAAALGFPEGDAIAALFVGVLVVLAAGRLLRRNVDVLMDRTPAGAEETARRAIAALHPPVELRRLRVRESGGTHLADVVIGIAPGAAVGQGHAAADRVEDAVRESLPDADVVVHVEPRDADAALRERVLAAALCVPRVRELHNLALLDVDGRVEVSLHLKLPGDLPLGPGARGRGGGRAGDTRRSAGGRGRSYATSSRWRRPPRRARSRSTPTRSSASSARRRARPRASFASCGRTTASSPSSRSRSGAKARSPTRTSARARSRRACARRFPASPTSWCTRSREALHVPSRGAAPRARVARPDRRRPRHPARRADAAGVLHRRRPRARARRVPARRSPDARARAAPAGRPRVRRAGLVRVREPGGDREPGGGDRRLAARGPAQARGRDRRRRRDRRVHDPRRLAPARPRRRRRTGTSRSSSARSSSRSTSSTRTGSRGSSAPAARSCCGAASTASTGSAARDLALEGTSLKSGDLIAGPALADGRGRAGLAGRDRGRSASACSPREGRPRLGRDGHRGRRPPSRAARVRRRADLRRRGEQARKGAHAQRGHRARVRERARAAARGRRLDARQRARPRGLRRLRAEARPADRVERLPRAHRADPRARRTGARRRREPARPAAGRLARAVSRGRHVRGLRTGVQALRPRLERGRVRLRRRRLLRPLRRPRSLPRLRARRARRVPRRPRVCRTRRSRTSTTSSACSSARAAPDPAAVRLRAVDDALPRARDRPRDDVARRRGAPGGRRAGGADRGGARRRSRRAARRRRLSRTESAACSGCRSSWSRFAPGPRTTPSSARSSRASPATGRP